MNTSVVMQVKVEAGLQARFQAAAAREHRGADQVLGRLMREYVGQPTKLTDGRDPVAMGYDRDLEAWARRQQGWHCCPFGGD
ncbi:hypothetical protein [Stenotrophomonas rhizophila]|uniref:hypothetical protein n=1 Tax=Stenotrophomonas rhizophila TaxID=216778 RepID=UPI001E65AD2E|nr:hypothetical protein [Stenotrophomonas rhizophila]MCC7635173.1 hypothetical protein [Stenotrophomonas rhizophila]MCC7664612.1 hypothetical protein [Stenotrophomonas rhizophila]